MSLSLERVLPMSHAVRITRHEFLEDRQGRTFADVLDDREQPFDEVLAFFDDAERQRRMEDAETHHDRAALAGVVRELLRPSLSSDRPPWARARPSILRRPPVRGLSSRPR